MFFSGRFSRCTPLILLISGVPPPPPMALNVSMGVTTANLGARIDLKKSTLSLEADRARPKGRPCRYASRRAGPLPLRVTRGAFAFALGGGFIAVLTMIALANDRASFTVAPVNPVLSGKSERSQPGTVYNQRA
jgi:hypothetical protein